MNKPTDKNPRPELPYECHLDLITIAISDVWSEELNEVITEKCVHCGGIFEL